jgi:hypothetical protein
MKPSTEQGYSEEQLAEIANPNPTPKPLKEVQISGFTFYETICPLGVRTGLKAGPDATNLIESTLVEAKTIIDKNL